MFWLKEKSDFWADRGQQQTHGDHGGRLIRARAGMVGGAPGEDGMIRLRVNRHALMRDFLV